MCGNMELSNIARDWRLSCAIVLAAALLYGLHTAFLHPLRRYPGPWLAKFTDYWRFKDVRGRQSHRNMIAMHEKYGPVVRTGPNTLSFSSTSFLTKIYGPGQGFTKSAFYLPFQGWMGNTIGYNLFTTRDPHYHSSIKKPVASDYGLKAVLEYEPIVDDCVKTYVRRMREDFVQSGREKACDMGLWMQYYAFDVIALMTWGKPFGFLDRGEDVNNMIERLDARLDVVAPMSQMPWLDWLTAKNWVINLFRDRTNKFALLAADKIQERQRDLKKGPVTNDAATVGKSPPSTPRLFIDRFLAAQQAHPTVVDDRLVVIYTTSNVMAGSDTVAIALRTIMYMVARDARVRGCLLAELDAMTLSFPVTWEQSQRMPYLEAVVLESLRIHPPVGQGLERVVPAEGLSMDDGVRLPAGVQVGVHPWAVAHLNEDVWGAAPKVFRPERWLRAEGETTEDHRARVALMKRSSLAFGAGSRACMGRHLGLLQIYKLIPSLFMKFRFHLAEQGRLWDCTCSWFVRQSGMDMFVEEN